MEIVFNDGSSEKLYKNQFENNCWYRSDRNFGWYCYKTDNYYIVFIADRIIIVSSSQISDEQIFYKVDGPKKITLDF